MPQGRTTSPPLGTIARSNPINFLQTFNACFMKKMFPSRNKNASAMMCSFAILLVAMLFAVSGSAQTTYYWIGGSGNWASGKFSTTSGGGSCSCTPAITDSVVFDANSGTPTVTLTATVRLTSKGISFNSSNVTFAGAFTDSVAYMTINSSQVTFVNNVVISTGLTMTGTNPRITENAGSNGQGFTFGTGGAFSLVGNSTTNYFTGNTNSYWTFNTTTPLTAFFNPTTITVGNLQVSNGNITLGNSLNASRMNLGSFTTNQQLILAPNVVLTLGANATSIFSNSASAGAIDASASGSKVTLTSVGASYLQTTGRIFKANTTINELEININSGYVFTSAFPLTVNKLTLTQGCFNNTTNNVTVLNGGTVTRSNQNAILYASPNYGAATLPANASDRVAVVINGSCNSGFELLPTTGTNNGKIGTLTINSTFTYTVSQSFAAAPTLTAAGGGYSTNPAITFTSQNSGTNATASVVALSNGGVSTFGLTNVGNGFTTAPAYTFAAPSGQTAWAGGQSITATGTVRTNASKVYYSTTTGTTVAGAGPTHTTGAVIDGTGGVTWQYVSATPGITATGSATAQSGTGIQVDALTVNGTLNFANCITPTTLSVTGSITLGSSGVISASTLSNTVQHTLNVGGNITGGGASSSINLFNAATRGINLVFNGATTQTVSGTFGTLTFAGLSTSGSGTNVLFSTTPTISGAASIAANTTVQTGVTINTPGGMSVSGTFQLNAGGWVQTSGAGAWSYTNGTLVFNNTSSYGVANADVFWPTSNGPTNVNILQGGLTLNSANRTVSGVFQTAAGVTLNSSTLTLNGTAQLNTGGFFNQSPTYGSSSTLVYNTGTTYGVGSEWVANATSGVGVPQNVTIGATGVNNSGLSFGSASQFRQLLGDLTISNASTGNSLSLSSALGGDLYIRGSFTNNGTFTHNTRAVVFNGTSNSTTQTVSGTFNGSSTTNCITYFTMSTTGTAGVTLATPVNVSSTLTLNSGIITTTATNILTLSGTIAGSASTGSNTAHINGPLKWTFNTASGTYTYPVGKSGTLYRLALTTPNTGGASISTTVEAFASGNSAGGTIDGTLSAVSSEYWQVTSSSALSSVASVALTSGSVNSSSVVAYGDGGTYTTKGGTGGSGGTVTSTTSLSTPTTQYYSVGTLPQFSLGTVVPTAISGISGQANASGYYGQTITINGFGFTASPVTLTIGGVSVTPSSTSNTAIVFAVPTTVSSGTLQISQSGTDLTTTFTVLGYVTNANTDWNTASTWLSNSLPTASSIVTINNDITVNATVASSPATVTVQSSKSISVGASGVLTVSTTLTNNGTVTTTSGASLTTTNTFTNAGTLTMTAGGTVSIGTSGTLTSTGTFNHGTGTINFVGGTPTYSGITNFASVTIGGGVNFSGAIINGTLRINAGGYVNTTAPAYSATATLQYNTGTTYGRSIEWTASSGTIGTTVGYPQNVQVSNNTTVNMPNGASLPALGVAGNLTVDAGSSLYMDFGTPASTGALTVGGNVVLNGNLSLGNIAGGDLYVGGNWTRTGTFTPNGRAVFFNGSSNSTINSATTFDYLLVAKSSGSATITLGANTTVNQDLTLTLGILDYSTSTITVAGNVAVGSGTIATASAGQLVMTGNSKTIPALTLGNFSINGTTNKVTATGLLTFASGSTLNIGSGDTLDLGSNTISVGASFTNTGTGAIKTSSTATPALPTGRTWTGWVMLTNSSASQTLPPGTYNNIDLDYSTLIARNIDQGNGIGTGTINISGQLKWSGTGAIAFNKTTISAGATATLPFGLTFYNLTFSGVTAPLFSGGTGSTINIGATFNPGSTTSLQAGNSSAIINFSAPSGGGVVVSSQTVPSYAYPSLTISGNRGAISGVYGTVTSGSTYLNNLPSSIAAVMTGLTISDTAGFIPGGATVSAFSSGQTSSTSTVSSLNNAVVLWSPTNATTLPGAGAALTSINGTAQGGTVTVLSTVNNATTFTISSYASGTNPTLTLSSVTGLGLGMVVNSVSGGSAGFTAGALISGISGNNVTFTGTFSGSGGTAITFQRALTLSTTIASNATNLTFSPVITLSASATGSGTTKATTGGYTLALGSGITVANGFVDSHSGTPSTLTANTITLLSSATSINCSSADTVRYPITINSGATVTLTNRLLMGNTLTVAGTLNNGTNSLTAAVGFAQSVTGTIQTQSSTTPLPTGQTWGGTIQYNGTTQNQNIMVGTYNNLDISGGTTGTRVFTNGGTYTIQGNYTAPTGSGAVTTTGSTVIFSGSAAQTITNPATFGSLTINKTGTANALTLNARVTVGTVSTGTLTLTSGRVVTTASNSLTLADTIPSALSGGSATAYVDGPLRRYVRAASVNYIFPVGNYVSAANNYFVDTLTSASTTDTISVTAVKTNLGSADGTTISSVSTNEYWVVKSVLANTLNMSFAPASLGIFDVLASSTTASGTYASLGGTPTTTSVAGAVSTTANTDVFIAVAKTNTPAPTITNISSSNPGGTTFYAGATLTITGSDLSNPTSVTVGGQSVTPTSNDGTTIVLTVPSNAATGVVTVSTAGGTATFNGTFNNAFVSIIDGSWSTASTWNRNATPTTGSNVIINTQVTLNANLSATAMGSLTINSGDSLWIGSATAASQLVVTGSFVNDGILKISSPVGNFYSYFTANGTSTNNGIVRVHRGSSSSSLIIGGAFANAGTVIDSSIFQINAGGSVTGNGITYGNNASLLYNTGATAYTPGSEWIAGISSGAGVPANVQIGFAQTGTIVSGTNVNFGTGRVNTNSFVVRTGYTATIANGNTLTVAILQDSGIVNIGTSQLNTTAIYGTHATLNVTSGTSNIGTQGNVNVYGYLKLNGNINRLSSGGNTGKINIFDYAVYEAANPAPIIPSITNGITTTARVWPSNSTLYYTGLLGGPGSGDTTQTFGNVIINNTAQTGTITFMGFNSVNKMVILNSGPLNSGYAIRYQNNTAKTWNSLQVGGAYSFNGSTITPAHSMLGFSYNSANTTTTVTGDVTIGSGDTLVAYGTGSILEIGGDFTVNGGFTNTNTTVSFTGSSAATISGVDTVKFNNLTINKTGSLSSATVTLDQPVTVAAAGTLTLTAGRVVTTSSNFITHLNTTAASVTGSSSAYIDGTLARAVAAAGTGYDFPIGNTASSGYLPVTINTVGSASTITVTANKGATGGSANGTTVTSISNAEYWNVKSSVANAVSLDVTPLSLGSNTVIASSTTKTGSYASIGGIPSVSSVAAATTLSTSNVFYVVGVFPPATITSVSSCIPSVALNNFYTRDTLTITGTNFQATSTVTVGGQAATIVDATDVPTSLKVLVSATASTGTVVVGSASFSGTLLAGYVTRYDGSWNNGVAANASLPNTSIWLGGSQPTGTITATIRNIVTVSSSVSGLQNITINSGASLTTSNVGWTFNSSNSPTLVNNGTLSIGNSANYTNVAITNNGTYSLSQGITFSGGSFTNNRLVTITGAPTFTNYTLTNNSGDSITATSSMSWSGTTTITNNGYFKHSGTAFYVAAGSTITFNGSSMDTINTPTLSGTGATLTFTKAPYINGNFNINYPVTINGAEYPTYSSGGAIYYNTGAAFTVGHEWKVNTTSGAGYPAGGVTIGGQSATNAGSEITFGAGTYTLGGAFRVLSGLTQDVPSTTILKANGGMTINGTLNIADGAKVQSGGAVAVGSSATVNIGSSILTALADSTQDAALMVYSGALTDTGTVNNFGYLRMGSNNFTLLASGSLSPKAYSVFEADNNNPTFPIASWPTTSALYLTGATNSFGTNITQAFGDVILNNTAQSGYITPVGFNNVQNLVVLNTGANVATNQIRFNNVTNTWKSLQVGGSFTINGNTINSTFANISLAYTTSSLSTTIASNFTIGANGSVTSSNSTAINVAGNFANSGTFTQTTGTTTFNGTTAQSITGATTFYGLANTNTSGTLSVNSAIGATTLNIAANAVIDMKSNALAGSSLTTSGAGILRTQSTSATPLPASKTWAFNVEFNNATGGQSIVAGTFNGGLTNSNTSGINSITAGITVNGLLTLNTNSVLALNNAIVIAGTLTGSTGAGTLRILDNNSNAYRIPVNLSWSGTVNYASGGNNRIVPGTYNNLSLDNGTAAGISFGRTTNEVSTITVNGTLTSVSTSFTPNNCTFVFGGTNQVIPASISFYNLSLTGTGTTFSNGTIYVSNTFTPGAITSANQGTIAFNGTGAQSIPVFNYAGLTISGARTSNSVTLPAGTVGVSGAYAHTATYTTGSTVLNGSTFDFNGTGTQTVSANTYNNLTISGSRTGNVTLASGTISVAGNFNRSATFSSGSMTASGNTINFNGAADQTISAASGTLGFNNLTLNNTKSGGGVLTLNNPVTLSGNLNLTAGKISLGSNNLTLASASTVSGASSSNYVVVAATGKLVKSSLSSAAFTLPIGTTTSYAPVTLTTTTGNPDITAGVTAFPISTGTVADATKVVQLQWSLLSNKVGTTSTVKLQFNTSNGAAGFDHAAACEIGRYTTTYVGNVYSVGVPTINGSAYTVSAASTPIANTGDNLFIVGNTNAVFSIASTTWTGATNTDWETFTNWTNGVPVSSRDAIINVTTNKPVIASSAAAQTVKALTLASGAIITNNSTLNVTETLTNSGTITGTGSLVLNGSSAQSVSGTGTVVNLTINNSNGVTVASGSHEQYVTGTLTLRSGTFTTNGNVTLKSTSIANTAVLAPVGTAGNNGAISGNVTVERFIPKGYRTYRDFAPSVFNAGSIFNNWQEGGSYANNGYGIFITGTTAANASHAVDATTGLDQTVNSVKSAYTYTGGVWSAITNTKTTDLNPFSGYRLLIRGDRTFNMYTTPISTVGTTGWLLMHNATNLRATGNLITGNVEYSTSGVTNAVSGATYNSAAFGLNSSSTTGFSSVGNPYVAPIDWKNIWDNNRAVNLTPNYYYLDPTLGSTGAYVSYNALSDVTSNGTIGTRRYIQSGQAFFVENNSSTSPSLTITEADKAISSTKTAVFGNSASRKKLAINLMKADGTEWRTMDAATVVFDQQFSNDIRSEDAVKMINSGENLSIVNNGKLLSIEARQPAQADDQLPLSMDKMTSSTYALNIDATNYKNSGLDAILVDALDNSSRILTAGENSINFTVDAKNPATYANRFSIVFKTVAKTATISTPIAATALSIYPNPLVGKAINVRLGNQAPTGKYVVIIYNSLGQKVLESNLEHAETSAAHAVKLGQQLSKGVYQVTLQSTVNSKLVYQSNVVVE